MNTIQLECLVSVLEKELSYENHIVMETMHKVEGQKEKLDYFNSQTQLQEMEAAINTVKERIKEIRREREKKYSRPGEANNQINREELKEFTKKFKHEFLTQIKYFSGSFDDIVKSVESFIPNDSFGICAETYVRYLWEHGYFQFKDILDKNSGVYLTNKAKRYLEQEANKSLKR